MQRRRCIPLCRWEEGGPLRNPESASDMTVTGAPFSCLRGCRRSTAWEAGASGDARTMLQTACRTPGGLLSPLALSLPYPSHQITKWIRIFLVFGLREPCL